MYVQPLPLRLPQQTLTEVAAQIARDPRFGRNSELPGECPFLNGEYATHYVSGMQQPDPHGHPLMLAYLKHFDACEYMYSMQHAAV